MSFSMAAATILATDPTPICTTTEPGLIGTITDWLIMLMETIGGIGVALAIALESIFPPIPSEVILPLSGFTAARGTLSLPGAIIWATIGSVLGAWTLYGISRWVGLHRINLAADKIPGVSRKDVSKANDWFTKYGTWSVLIGRVIPVVRSLISIPAGFNRMNFLHFTGWTLLGLGRVEHHPRFRRLPARRPVVLDSRRARRVRGRGHRGRDCDHRMVRGAKSAYCYT